MNTEIDNIRDKKLSEFGNIGDEEEKQTFGKKLEANAISQSESLPEPTPEVTPETVPQISPEPTAEMPVEQAIATEPEPELEPKPEPIIEPTIEPVVEASAQETTESPISVKDDPYQEASMSGAPQVGSNTGNKKKLLMLIIVIITFFVGGYLTFMNGDSEEEVENIAELDALPALTPPTAPDFIDNGESHNQFMQKNPEAKQNNISIFNFDINQCLQRFSDDECMNMYEDSLKIEENRSAANLN